LPAQWPQLTAGVGKTATGPSATSIAICPL
jgi:hypothetical protein